MFDDDDLRDLYQEVILDHSRHPRNFGHEDHANRRVRGSNPLCGDRMTLYLTVEDGVVKDAKFEGNGCAISMASASLMTERVKGMKADDAKALFRRFHELVTGEEAPSDPALDKLAVFSGVREFPVRVKCATLAWHTLAAALEGREGEVSTEEA